MTFYYDPILGLQYYSSIDEIIFLIDTNSLSEIDLQQAVNIMNEKGLVFGDTLEMNNSKNIIQSNLTCNY